MWIPDTCLSAEDIALYVSGGSSAQIATEIVRHVESCESCRAQVAATVRAGRGATSPTRHEDGVTIGSTIGRYVVRSALGSGAMSHVYEAEDPELNRTIALKVVRHADAEADARALREGRALARLAHPNVVAVHDVGTWSGGVFLAMELVAGATVRTWAARRSWREIARVFADAARGLAAAHRAGLVHRDLKPDNLIVDPEGRIRLIDFGLAIDGDRRPATVGGTPAYMAPEQLRGERVDARSDQYGLVASLYEALEQQRPTASPVFRRRLPGWLRQLIARGMSPQPEQRYADLDVLARALERGLGARRRRIAYGAAVLGASALAGTYAISAHRASVARVCEGASAHLAGIWDAPREIEVTHALLASGRPYAGTVAASVARALDGYTSAWTAMRTEACEATHVRGEQSAQLLDLRIGCLDRRLDEVRALTDELRTNGAAIVDKAVQAATALNPLETCADRSALGALIALPPDPLTRARVAAARATLAEVKAIGDTGRHGQALRAIEPLLPTIAPLGYAPLSGEVLFRLAMLQDRTGDHARAVETFQRSAAEAEAGHDDATKARAWIAEARAMGTTGSQYAEADRLLAQARATVVRLGGEPDLEWRIENAVASIRFFQGKFGEAYDHDREAVARAIRAFGAHDARVAREQLNEVNALERLGRYPEATKELTAAIAALEASLGPDHPDVLTARGTAADLLFDQARYDDARRAYADEIAGLRRIYGPGSPDEIAPRDGIGQVAEQQHDDAAALAAYQEELALVEAQSGAETLDAARVRLNIGNALMRAKRFPEAVASYARARQLAEKLVGHDSPVVAGAVNGTAATLIEQEQDAKAIPLLEEALAIYRKIEGPQHPDVGMVLEALGRSELEVHADVKAIAHLEESLRIREAALGPDHPSTVQTRMYLGSGLWVTGGDHKRARALITQARDSYRAIGDDHNAAALDDWLRTHH